LLQDERLQELLRMHPRNLVVDLAREELDATRARLRAGTLDQPDLIAGVVDRARALVELPLRPVINATGVVIHTNLGRAPLSAAAIRAMAGVADGYSNLEFDLVEGTRGSRHDLVSPMLTRLTGADDAVVVNNCAAALLLILSTFARDGSVVVSRGELVEIGGGVRIPDVLAQSGARLVEVGTTNRTYAADFERAIDQQTRLLLRVHTSNFRVVGFVHSPSTNDLAELAASLGLLLVDDLGSGALLDTARFGLAREPMVQESVAAGADLVCFSGDKLLGGPQAGIIVGRRDPIGRLKREPMLRAIRPDKATLAALGATLGHYVQGEAERELPVWRMIGASAEEIGRRASSITTGLDGWDVLDGESAIGGGSLPGETLPTRLIAAPMHIPPRQLLARLRSRHPAVVGRVEHDRAVFDLRTVPPELDTTLGEALTEAACGS
jgi:L-seryl-tRNA(Ser) seleniumtransferase